MGSQGHPLGVIDAIAALSIFGLLGILLRLSRSEPDTGDEAPPAPI